MIRAGINDKENPIILAGLSEGNIERLKAGQPIKAAISSFGVDLPGSIAIMYGKTETDIEAELRRAGLIGSFTQVSRDAQRDKEMAAMQEHKHILVATVGLPKSGKTTWARSQAWPIVCPDAIRLALHGQRFNANAEPLVWAVAKTMVRALFLAGHQTVILDATNVSRKRRDEWTSKEWATFFKVFDVSPDECCRRAADDAEILPVIGRMASEWESLTDSEKAW